MTKISFLLAALIAMGGLVWDQPAIARLTPDDEAAVPPDIFKAYRDIGQHKIYACPRIALQKADRQFVNLREKIRLRYRLDFDSLQDDEIVIHCPSPKSIPDFNKRAKAYGAAVERLGKVLNHHPSPINEELAQENAAIRFLILEVLNHFVAREIVPICINGDLLGVDTQDLAKLKKETVEASGGPVNEAYHAQLHSLFFSKMAPSLPSRKFDATLYAWGKWRVRPATFDECSRHLTYRIRRPIIRGDRAILSGINVRSDGSTEFSVVAEKSDGEWGLVYYRPYGDYSERRPSTILQGIPPSTIDDNFYILE